MISTPPPFSFGAVACACTVLFSTACGDAPGTMPPDASVPDAATPDGGGGEQDNGSPDLGGQVDDAGAGCGPNEQDNDGDGTCLPTCAATDCVRGTCDDTSGTSVCTCDPGYAGAACDVPSCAGVDCGFGICSNIGGVTTCACDPGYHDDDADLVCVEGCDATSCSMRGVCDDTSGAVVCTCETGYAGDACDTCATADGYVANAAGDCVIAILGVGSIADPYRYADDTIPASCQGYVDPPTGYAEAPELADGRYLIDPHANAPFAASCDMTTGGGGWTLVDAATGRNGFMVEVQTTEGTCGFDTNDAPLATDGTGDLSCNYDLGAAFNALRAVDVQIEAAANAAVGHRTDISWRSGDWGSPCGSAGDVRVGTAQDDAPVFSIGEQAGQQQCGGALSVANGTLFDLSGRTEVPESTTLRVQFLETGGEDEGWRWAGGAFAVRHDDFAVTGSLSVADPGVYEDGTHAASCAEYFDGRFADGSFYAATSGTGFYRVGAPDAGEPTFCSEGRAWETIMAWDRRQHPTTDTLESLLGLVEDETFADVTIDRMTTVASVEDGVEWYDNNATGDVLSWAADLSGGAYAEVGVHVAYTGVSLEGSGVWLWAEGSGGPANLLCQDSTATSPTSYSASERALIPYACGDALGDVAWDQFVSVSVAPPATRFVLRSLQMDVAGGDLSILHRLVVVAR